MGRTGFPQGVLRVSGGSVQPSDRGGHVAALCLGCGRGVRKHLPGESMNAGCGFASVTLCTQKSLCLPLPPGVTPFIPQNLTLLPGPPVSRPLCSFCALSQVRFRGDQQLSMDFSASRWRKVPSLEWHLMATVEPLWG